MHCILTLFSFCILFLLDDSDDEPRRAKRAVGTKRAGSRLVRQSSSDFESGESESASDGDWMSGKKRTRGGKRRKRRKRQRLGSPADEEAALRAQRVSDRKRQAISYAEGDDDEEIMDSDDLEAYRYEKANPVEEDPNIPHIEAVIDYRPANGEPDSEEPLADFEPSTIQVNIKWLRKSYRHNTWSTLEGLKNTKGYKRVTNYVKRIQELADYVLQPSTSPEEREECVMQREEIRAAVEDYVKVERVVAEREAEDDPDTVEYLVKWLNLTYADSTWEKAGELTKPEDLAMIDAFHEREHNGFNSALAPKAKRLNPFSAQAARKPFKKLPEQPKWLDGGPENRKLRDYQLAGLNWLAYSWVQNRNVILADEMGLGKTLQSISLLGYLLNQKKVPGPFLVIVPLSTIAAWVREFARWLPTFNVVTYSGDSTSRARIREYEFYPKSKGKSSIGTKFHVLLTTPELVMADAEYVESIRWSMMVIDEAHRLKNENSSLHQILSGFPTANRLLITGTPLQNSVRELWALLSFLNPAVFKDAEDFEAKFSFSAMRDADNVALLHTTLRPYILRRQKIDVEKSLPKKSYAVLRVGMASSQQQYYKWILTKNFAALNSNAKRRGMGPSTKLLNIVMELKKCCNHPYLFQGFEDRNAPNPLMTMIKSSGKMILLDKLLLRLREKGHRVLIFSQMVRMLDILQDYCRMRNFQFQRLDGSMRNDIRQRAVDHFNAEGSTDFVFLLSTRAGGLGINLATADTVIIFDSDWNPQNDLQAESRAHRIGQTKDVKVFRFLARDTVEEDILERAKRKRVLEHLVIHGVEQGGEQSKKDAGQAFKKEELSAILRFGAEKLFTDRGGPEGVADVNSDVKMDEGIKAEAPVADSKEGGVEAEEKRVLEMDDIDALLERGTEEGGEEDETGVGASMGDSLLNAFKWADFVAEDEDEEEPEPKKGGKDLKDTAAGAAKKLTELEKKRAIAAEEANAALARDKNMLDNEKDGEFWNRVIPEDMKQTAVASKLYLGPRQRRRTKTYADSEVADNEGRKTRSKRKRKGGSDKMNDLSAKEIKILIRSFRRYGELERIDKIVKEAELENRCDSETATGLLQSLMDEVQTAVERAEKPTVENGGAQNDKEKEKGPPVTIDFRGESVNAESFLRRIAELKVLGRLIRKCEVDTAFRMKNLMKAPSYSVRWAMHHDSMLLVGIYRHGYGNWEAIAADSELGLGAKVNINHRNEAGPDAQKLSRRATALLKALEKDEHTKREKIKQKAAKKKSPRSSAGATRGRGRGRGRRKSGPGRKKRDVHKRDNVDEKPRSKSSQLGDLLASNKGILEELKELSAGEVADTPNGKKLRVQRTKRCLMKLGNTIEEVGGQDRQLKKQLWKHIHRKCRTNVDGHRLSMIYAKLAATKRAMTQSAPSASAA